jgi:hypothetical protein
MRGTPLVTDGRPKRSIGIHSLTSGRYGRGTRRQVSCSIGSASTVSTAR